jgi:hypothetical protein
LCVPAVCAPGEQGCYIGPECSGYCSSNFRCKNGTCNLSTCSISEPTCYSNQGDCFLDCSTQQVPKKSNIYLVILFISLGVLTLISVNIYIVMKMIV